MSVTRTWSDALLEARLLVVDLLNLAAVWLAARGLNPRGKRWLLEQHYGFAQGGIVSGTPMIRIIGEKGPEQVIPLKDRP